MFQRKEIEQAFSRQHVVEAIAQGFDRLGDPLLQSIFEDQDQEQNDRRNPAAIVENLLPEPGSRSGLLLEILLLVDPGDLVGAQPSAIAAIHLNNEFSIHRTAAL